MDSLDDISALLAADEGVSPNILARALRKREALGELGMAGGEALAPQAQATLSGARQQQAALLERALAAQRAKTQAANDAIEARRAAERLDFERDRYFTQTMETERHNRAMEARPPAFPVIMTGEGPVRIDPRDPSKPAEPVMGPGGKPLAPPDKPPPRMTDRTKDDLNTMAATAESVASLRDQFRDDYAGFGVTGGIAASAAKTLGSMGSEEQQNMAAFWADWDKLINLPERNAVFGASLSAGEKASWEGARNIKPGSSPDLVRRKLDELLSITRKKGRALAESAKAEGYSGEAVDALTRGAFNPAPPRRPRRTVNGETREWDGAKWVPVKG